MKLNEGWPIVVTEVMKISCLIIQETLVLVSTQNVCATTSCQYTITLHEK